MSDAIFYILASIVIAALLFCAITAIMTGHWAIGLFSVVAAIVGHDVVFSD